MRNTYYLRRAALPLAVFLLHCVLVLYLYAIGHKRLRFGLSAFYGPKAFLATCSRAMTELQKIDQEMFTAILQGRYFVWYDPKKLDDFERHFSINEPFCTWGHLGVIAFLVYAHNKTVSFSGRLFPLTDHTEALGLRRAVRLETRNWLSIHGFPPELIECYDK